MSSAWNFQTPSKRIYLNELKHNLKVNLLHTKIDFIGMTLFKILKNISCLPKVNIFCGISNTCRVAIVTNRKQFLCL